jgi:hypothetical protein
MIEALLFVVNVSGIEALEKKEVTMTLIVPYLFRTSEKRFLLQQLVG